MGLFADQSALEYCELLQLRRGIPVCTERGESLICLPRASGLQIGEGGTVAQSKISVFCIKKPFFTTVYKWSS